MELYLGILGTFIFIFFIKFLINIFRKINSKLDSKTDSAMKLFNNGNYSKALKLFESISKSHNLTITNYYTYLGLCNHNLKNYEEAIRNYNTAIDSDRNNISAKLYKVDLEYQYNPEVYNIKLIDILKDNPNHIGVLLRQAQYYFDIEDYYLCEGCINSVLEQDMTNTWAIDLQFNIFIIQKKYQEAKELAIKSELKDDKHNKYLEKLNKILTLNK